MGKKLHPDRSGGDASQRDIGIIRQLNDRQKFRGFRLTTPFRELSEDLGNALGLSKEKIKLPKVLLDQLWPMIESLKQTQVTNVLFTVIAPLFTAIDESENNKAKLLENPKNSLLVGLIKPTIRRVMEELPSIASDAANLSNTLKAIEIYLPGVSQQKGAVIADSLQTLIVGENSFLKKNSPLLQSYLEGAVLQFFATQQSENGFILENLTDKIKQLAVSLIETTSAMGVFNKDEAIKIIDAQIMKDFLKIESPNDLRMIPIPLRAVVYNHLRDQIKQLALPFMEGAIENNKLNEGLKALSGSAFLSDFSKELSKDLVNHLPTIVRNYDAYVVQLFDICGNKNPTSDQIKNFINLVEDYKKDPSKFGKLTNQTLVDAFILSEDRLFSEAEVNEIKKRLQATSIKKNLLAIYTTPEALSASIITELKAPMELKQNLSNELNAFVAGGSISSIAQTTIEFALLKFFIAIAENNPPSNGKDSIIVLTEKLLKLTTEQFLEAKLELRDKKGFELVAKNIRKVMMTKEGLGIFEALESIPEPLRGIVKQKLDNKIATTLISFRNALPDPEIEASAKKTVAKQVVRHAVDLALSSLPNTFVAAENKVTNKVFLSLQETLEALVCGNYNVANTILDYSNKNALQNIFSGTLADISTSKAKSDSVPIIAEILSKPLNAAVDTILEFEEKHSKEFNERLITNFFNVAANHFSTINEVEKLSQKAGQKTLRNEDFVRVKGTEIHSAVPVAPLNFDRSIREIEKKTGLQLDVQVKDALRKVILKLIQDEKRDDISLTNGRVNEAVINVISAKMHFSAMEEVQIRESLEAYDTAGQKSLRAIIHKEAKVSESLRIKEFYAPQSKLLMSLLFPNGKDDLTFIPKDARESVWNLFGSNLPTILPMITDVILSESTINNIVLSTLESVNESIIHPQPQKAALPTPPRGKPTALDSAASNLIKQIVGRMDLPSIITSNLFDKEGNLLPAIEQSIGDALRAQFNGSFLKTTLETTFEAVLKNEIPDPSLVGVKRTSAEEKLYQSKIVQPKINKTTKMIINNSISKTIDDMWNTVQKKWDAKTQVLFGKAGLTLKKGLDAMFRFVFFTIIGNILSFIFRPVLRAVLHKWLATEKNMNALLDPFRKEPSDQKAAEAHALYNEDLVYKLVESIQTAVAETLERA